MTAELLAVIRTLVESVLHDEARSGGLLSRETLRRAAELAIAVEADLTQVIEAAPQMPQAPEESGV
jgi:hypothetical protein